MDILIKIIADFLFVVVVVWAFIIMVTLPKNIRTEYIVRGLAAGILSVVVARITKLFYQHSAPFVARGIEPLAWHVNDANSFPSDHALLVFAAAFVAFVASKNPKVGLSLLALATMVGVGRVMAHVHWPIDVLASATITALVALILYSLPYKGIRPLKWTKGNSGLAEKEK